ncbi:MAG: N-acetylneuraminate synthase [Bacteroidetes bacterium]|nr:N-acetylneuraminate synthase [Bacteroidota bacterium]
MIELIAEIGQAHEGSLGIAHSYIDALAKTGIDAIKWQTHIAEAESSAFEEFRVPFSYEDKKRIDYWRRMEFTEEQWQGLKDHCEEKGLEFMSSPFSCEAVKLLERLGVKRYKIGSGEVTNHLMLEQIARTGKPIILSSGMSSLRELEATIALLKPFGNELSVLQCTTSYPTAPEDWGLNVIEELKSRFGLKVGFSDHSGDIYACLAAASVGADILEFHAVFSKEIFGPDSKASLTMDQISSLVNGVRQIETARKSSIDKSSNERFTKLKSIFEKTLSLNQDCKAGMVITVDLLEGKKPSGMGIPASEFRSVLGKTLVTDKAKWDFLLPSDIN